MNTTTLITLTTPKNTLPPLKQIFCGGLGGLRILITPDTMVSDMIKFHTNWENVIDVIIIRDNHSIKLDHDLSLFCQVKDNDCVFVVEFRQFLYDQGVEGVGGVYIYTKINESTIVCSLVSGDLSVKEFFRFVFNLKGISDFREHSKLFWSCSNSNKILDLNKISCRYVAKLNKVLLL
jgi:hypothetical protein